MSRKGWLLFIAMSVIWGIPYLFIKIALQELDPSVVVFARVGIAAIVLLPLAARRGGLRQFRKKWYVVAALACIQIAAPFLLISAGEQHIASSLTSLLIAADPLLVALFALRLDHSERVTGLRLVGLFIGIAGVITLLGFDVGGDKQRLLGAILVLLATACYALSVLLVKRPTIAALPRLGVVAVMCTTSTIVVSPLALTHLPGKIPDTEVIASLLVLGVICTALAYMIYFALIAEVGASRATVITYVNPAVAVLLGVILLGEPLNAAIIVGFLLIIAGSWLSTSNVLASPLKYLFRTRRQQQQNSEIMVGSIEKQAVNPNTKEHA
ncbi:MAG TPA: EamA family transporter [Ktedonobacteraceae bacterium]|nr:EamA family transporter [Ktedonobacteraceae bacterium]